jgi:hypothetical protein
MRSRTSSGFRAAWNWKAALVSAIGRACLFGTINLPAGIVPALHAASTELIYRSIASGFYGALTQHFAGRRATRARTAFALLVVTGLSHSIEYVVHRSAGTPLVGRAVLASIAVSLATTWLNLAAMRRGLLVAGRNEQSLRDDLRGLFALAIGRGPRVSTADTSHSSDA